MVARWRCVEESLEVQSVRPRSPDNTPVQLRVANRSDPGLTNESPANSVLIVQSDPVIAAGVRSLVAERRDQTSCCNQSRYP